MKLQDEAGNFIKEKALAGLLFEGKFKKAYVTFTCSKTTTKTPEKGVKYIQS